MAMLTYTSDVEMRSTTIPYRSSVPKMLAKKPCEMVLRFDRIERTIMLSLIVTAVGPLRGCGPLASLDNDLRAPASLAAASSPLSGAEEGGSGKMIVPLPLGFSTFLIRIGMADRIACSIVKGWMTSEP